MSVDAEIDASAARDLLASAAREAGALALRYFRPGARTSAQVESKIGGSPVTDADLAADALMKRRLREALPEAGWLSEETADDFERLSRRSLIVVDPIDGTRAFVIGDPHWAVSAALVIDGRPIAGVVHAPALDETYAAARGAGATLNGAQAQRRRRLASARRRRPEADHSGDGGEAWRRRRRHSARAVARLPLVHRGARRRRSRRRGRKFARLGHRSRGSSARGGGRAPHGRLRRAAPLQCAAGPARRAPRRGASGRASPHRGLSGRDRPPSRADRTAAVFERLAFLPRRRQSPAGEPAHERKAARFKEM